MSISSPKTMPPFIPMSGKLKIPIYRGLLGTQSLSCHGVPRYAAMGNRCRCHTGIREVHTNTMEGIWTTVRNFLRPFRGVHKKLLAGYIAICEFRINLKRITGQFISKLVDCTITLNMSLLIMSGLLMVPMRGKMPRLQLAA